MSTILTQEAAEGFAAAPGARCPYLHSSPASMAWHFGQHMAKHDFPKPTPEAGMRDASRAAVTMGRGNSLNLRGRCDILLARFTWQHDNSFREVRS